jgi:hypothetical protein
MNFDPKYRVAPMAPCSQDEFEHKHYHQPQLIQGQALAWPAMRKWTFGFFREHFGNDEVMVTNHSEQKTVRLADYLDYLEREDESESPYYLTNWLFYRDHPELRQDYKAPVMFRDYLSPVVSQQDLLTWIYIGGKGSFSSLHIDVYQTPAWNGLICGTKLWAFYSPLQTALMGEGEVNTFCPDLLSHPSFAQARPYIIVQKPGDVVYSPPGWWHQVINLEATISVTENFVDRLSAANVCQVLENEHGLGVLAKSIRTRVTADAPGVSS